MHKFHTRFYSVATARDFLALSTADKAMCADYYKYIKGVERIRELEDTEYFFMVAYDELNPEELT